MKMLKPILGSMFAALLLVAGPANAKKVTMNIGYSVNEGPIWYFYAPIR